MAEAHIRKAGAIPSFTGYPGINPRRPFPASLCVSIDDEIVHGIPGPYRLKEGDIISLDVGVRYDGFVTDSATTVAVGKSTLSGMSVVSCAGSFTYSA